MPHISLKRKLDVHAHDRGNPGRSRLELQEWDASRHPTEHKISLAWLSQMRSADCVSVFFTRKRRVDARSFSLEQQWFVLDEIQETCFKCECPASTLPGLGRRSRWPVVTAGRPAAQSLTVVHCNCGER